MLYQPPYSIAELDAALQHLPAVPLPAHRLHEQCQHLPPPPTIMPSWAPTLGGCLDAGTIYYLDSLDALTRRHVLRHEAGHHLDLQRGKPATYYHEGWRCADVTRCSRPFG